MFNEDSQLAVLILGDNEEQNQLYSRFFQAKGFRSYIERDIKKLQEILNKYRFILLVYPDAILSYDLRPLLVKKCENIIHVGITYSQDVTHKNAVHIDKNGDLKKIGVASNSTIPHDTFIYSGIILLGSKILDKIYHESHSLQILNTNNFLKYYKVKGIPLLGCISEKNIGANTEINMKPCVFLDRDGVMIEDCHYPYKISDIKPYDSIVPLLRKANEKNWLIIVVTNQSGIAKGKFSIREYQICENYINSYFYDRGIMISAWYFCPYHEQGNIDAYKKNSLLRKPSPGMILKAGLEHVIDIDRSIMIGDKSSDKINLINLTTYFIQGQYKLSSKKNIFNTHQQLVAAIEPMIT